MVKLKLPDQLLKEVEVLAKQKGISVNEFLLTIVAEKLREERLKGDVIKYIDPFGPVEWS